MKSGLHKQVPLGGKAEGEKSTAAVQADVPNGQDASTLLSGLPREIRDMVWEWLLIMELAHRIADGRSNGNLQLAMTSTFPFEIHGVPTRPSYARRRMIPTTSWG
jgi:hypothetical protein